jgi:hypothetical protein
MSKERWLAKQVFSPSKGEFNAWALIRGMEETRVRAACKKKGDPLARP